MDGSMVAHVAVPMKTTSSFDFVMKVIMPANNTRNADIVIAIRPRAIGTRNNKYTGTRRIPTAIHTEITCTILNIRDEE